MESNRDKGLQRRTQVMGPEFVERAMGNADAFTQPMQDYLNEHCWGSTWQRDDLPLDIRSLITVAMLVALKAPTELKGHVRGALRNGCTPEQIRAVILHSAIYCGAPAAQEGLRAAKEVIDSLVDAP